MAAFSRQLVGDLSEMGVTAPIATLLFDHGPPGPANAVARRSSEHGAARLAICGIMKPKLFFDAAATHCANIRLQVALPGSHGLRPLGSSRIWWPRREERREG